MGIVKVEQNGEITEYSMECPECINGIVDKQIACGKPVSECCGGCTEMADCRVCNGIGRLDSDYSTDIYFAMIVSMERIRPKMNKFTRMIIDSVVDDNINEIVKHNITQ